MRKTILIVLLSFCIVNQCRADHIKGGFFSYEYLGPGTADPINSVRYKVTLTVYMLCSATPAQVSDPITFTIFNTSGVQLQNVSVSKTAEFPLSKIVDETCISGDQAGCYYKIVVYNLPSIELAKNSSGYIFSYQRCCRIAGIQNLVSPSNAVGNSFSITIPGTAVFPGAETNSSPIFPVNDTAVVCNGSNFTYSFKATDPNTGDSLAYHFCDALTGGGQGTGTGPTSSTPNPAAPPPYASVPYNLPFSGGQPMGGGVTIDPLTGIISGMAPNLSGEYVVCVCVSEYRQGVLLGITRKELHIQVRDCEPLDAALAPKPTTCDGFTVSFANDVTNQSGTTYHWTFGEPSSGTADTSFLETPTHTYALAGTYHARLRVSLAGLCIDSADLTVNVFPGFFPGFTAAGGCFTNPFHFTDTTKTNFGVVDTWSWNFGDETTLADTSHVRNPNWTYATSGPKTVTLTVTNSKGCSSVATFTADVLARPVITMDFKDTLICVPDAVTLGASGTGVFNWTPAVNIINANTPNPTVNPVSNTWYYAHLNDNGCLNTDSVNVRVVASVSLAAMPDTTICLTDPVRLGAQTDGLSFQWTPAATLDNPNILNPVATPVDESTPYTIRATIGTCFATDVVVVHTVPYPVANAGAPQTICYNASAQLNGSHDGSSFSWSPTSYLNNPTILNPISSPPRTTAYVLTVFDTKGCPKPGRDTVIITMLPKVRANAGRDTVVIVGQPLHFNGTGGVNYTWSPATWLSNPNIHDPVGVYNSSVDSIRYKLIVSDAAGCTDSAFVKVVVFKTKPSIFVPTAFTPNNDGLNDYVYPIAVGMQRIEYFSIYNRWGQLVFTTTKDRQGWDGRINGRVQDTNVFVWMVKAVDYLGKPYFLKGTVTLIR